MRAALTILWIFVAATSVGVAVLWGSRGPVWSAAAAAAWATLNAGIALRYIIREPRP